MSRPSEKTLKQLFALSNNRCAFPRCVQPLVDPSSITLVGEVCHIRAQRPGGPRYDPNQTENERHAFANLILLCSPHHTVVDDDEESYTIVRLESIKQHHETAEKSIEVTPEVLKQLVLSVTGNTVRGGSVIVANTQVGQTAHTITNVHNYSTPSGGPFEMALHRFVEFLDEPFTALELLQGHVRGAVSAGRWSLVVGVAQPPELVEAMTEFRSSLAQYGKRAKALELLCDGDARDLISVARQSCTALESIVLEVVTRGQPVSANSQNVLSKAQEACNAVAEWALGELKKPQKSVLLPRIEFKPRGSSSFECKFDLLVMLDNSGSVPDAEYKLEITIPRRFVPGPQSAFLDEASSTGEIAVFRRPRMGEPSPPAIYVGVNSDPVVHFSYSLKTNDFEDGSLDACVRAVVRRPDGGEAETSKRLAELHDCFYRDRVLSRWPRS